MLTLALLYAPQPLAPLLAEFFEVSTSEISWVISIALIPLAVAPLFYGYLLEIFSLKKILIISLIFCAIFQICATLSDNFYLFLSFRFLQALCIPAILTSLLTLLTRLESANLQKNIALYVGATTFGGFVGRVGGSYLSDLFSWQFSLNFFAFFMLVCGLSFILYKENNSHLTQTHIKDFLPFFKERKILMLFYCVFVMFFAFQSVTSFLPFHLKDIFETITQTQIGLIYLGFLTGVLSSLLIGKTIAVLGSRTNTAIFGLLVYVGGCFCMMVENFYFAFVAMFVFCSGMFITHAIFSALLNLNSTKKGLANGLYLAFYYSGGTLGSVLPSFYYESLGWNFLCLFTAFLLFSALLGFLVFRKTYEI